MKKKAGFRIAAAFLAAAFVFMTPGPAARAESAKTDLYINGVKLSPDVEPVIVDGSTFVPVRVLAETLGFTVGFDETTDTITLAQQARNVEIKMTIGSTKAYANNRFKTLNAAPMIHQERTMVPIRFVTETLGASVVWREGNDAGYTMPNEVNVYSQSGIATAGGYFKIGAKSAVKTFDKLPNQKDGGETKYDLHVPSIVGASNAAFGETVNKYFEEMLKDITDSVERSYNSQKTTGSSNNVREDLGFRIISDKRGFTSIMLTGYSYTGGANNIPYWKAVNIDFNGSKMPTLLDLFDRKTDINSVFIEKMNAIREAKAAEYEGVDPIRSFDARNYYVEGGSFVIFLQQNNLSTKASELVEFRIPINEVRDELLPEYKNLS